MRGLLPRVMRIGCGLGCWDWLGCPLLVMSTKLHRLPMTILGMLLIVVSLAHVALAWFTHENRWTYFRAVYNAPTDGQDPYEVARSCADRLAGDFLVPTLVSGACTATLAIAITLLVWRRGQ